MTFRFRLDPVLEQRRRIERERAGVRERAFAAQVVAERARDEILARRDATREQVVREHAEMDVRKLRALHAYLDYLDCAARAAQRRVDACAEETERARVALAGAARDRQVLQTLKDRRREAHLFAAALADQRELDDQNARMINA